MIRYNLYVRNISLDATEEELKEYFSQFGEVKNAKIMREQS
jgi:RNA recognition motif-containing protein